MKHFKHSAFSLIELLFVIVVLGIVASLGSDIIARAYESYISAKTNNESKTRLTHALHIISTHLKYRIKESVIGRDLFADNPNWATNFSAVTQTPANRLEILEWIGYDNDSLKGQWLSPNNVPGFSGFIDINSTLTTRSQLSLPGSRLDFAHNIIWSLSNNRVGLEGGIGVNQPAIFFKEYSEDINISHFWPSAAMVPDNNYSHQVECIAQDCTTSPSVINLLDGLPINPVLNRAEIVEHAYLAWSAYSIVPVQNNVNGINTDFNLTLSYNYQPWEGEHYNDVTTQSSLLIPNITLFDFNTSGTNSIEVRLCIDSGFVTNTELCAKEVIY